MTNDRSYRAALLTTDEAARLTRDAECEFHPDLRHRCCCPHLDVFHNHGQRPDGSHWKVCTFFGCQCEGEDTADEPHVVARRKAEALYAKHERWDIAKAWWLFGAGVGLIVGWLVS